MEKKSFIKDYTVYIGARAASSLLSVLPLGISLWIGRVIGFFMYHLHPKRKKIAYANLKAAFSKEKSPSELKSILKKTYRNYGQNIVEVMRVPVIDRGYLKKFVNVVGMGTLEKAVRQKKGIIFLTSHFGNWELPSLKSAQEGYPIYVMATRQGADRINDLLNRYREKLGCRVIPRGMALREIIKALRQRRIVGMIADQDAGRSGLFIDLLGRPASHAAGPARFARDTGSLILPIFIVRNGSSRHMLYLERPFSVSKTGNRDLDIKAALEKHASVLESYIKRYPDQWMWSYTRWKSTPVRKVLVLNDGRAGHLNQSLAAFDIIKRARINSGFRDEDTVAKIVDVKFKGRVRKTLLGACSAFSSYSCQGCMLCLRTALEKGSYDRLMSLYADIVISCGSSLTAVNILLSRENNAKNVVVMKPGPGAIDKFDVAIIPAHDKPKSRENIVITEGAPNLIGEVTMESGAKNIGDITDLSAGAGTAKKRLGLLIGGDSPKYSLNKVLALELIKGLEGLIESSDMELLVTTSRRTSKEVEDLLKERLGGNPRCKLLVIANENNVDNAVGGILHHSDIVLVSSESISMVSEAASSGKQTIAFDLEKKKNSDPKHANAIKRLATEEYIVHTPVKGIAGAVESLLQDKKTLKKLDNSAKIYPKLYKII